jgi:hypothetical protein
MKWSQGLCVSILLDGFCSFSPRPRLDPRLFVYIDCAVSNSKKASFKFRITNITDVVRAFAP